VTILRKKRILLLSEGFGTGHTQAAQALAVGLRRLFPNLQTRVMELGTFLHPTLAPLVFSVYRKTIVSQPKLYGLFYRSQAKKTLNRFARLALHRIFYRHTAEIIEQLKPDTIVCTHPFPSAVVARLKRAGLSIPLCTVITDYDVHGAWVSDEVNKYMVSTEDVKQKLMLRGVPGDRIEVTGIPVHPNFWQPNNREELRQRFGLKDMPTVLVMGGGWGLVQQEELLLHLASWADRIQLIFCMGSNEKARNRLENDPQFAHPNIHVYGFTREVHKLMDVSDLLITKPGGMTVTEAMAKRLPMLFYTPIPGQEEDNCNYFTERGIGEQIVSFETIDRRFERLLGETGSASRTHRVYWPSMQTYDPKTCHQAIAQMLS